MHGNAPRSRSRIFTYRKMKITTSPFVVQGCGRFHARKSGEPPIPRIIPLRQDVRIREFHLNKTALSLLPRIIPLRQDAHIRVLRKFGRVEVEKM